MITYKQLTLAEIFEDCQHKFDNDKYQFLSLLLLYVDLYCLKLFFLILDKQNLHSPIADQTISNLVLRILQHFPYIRM